MVMRMPTETTEHRNTEQQSQEPDYKSLYIRERIRSTAAQRGSEHADEVAKLIATDHHLDVDEGGRVRIYSDEEMIAPRISPRRGGKATVEDLVDEFADQNPHFFQQDTETSTSGKGKRNRRAILNELKEAEAERDIMTAIRLRRELAELNRSER